MKLNQNYIESLLLRPCILMETCVGFQVTPMYKNKNIQKIENELMETAPG